MSLNQQTCPRCGTRLERDLPGSLCLSCLLALGLKSDDDTPGKAVGNHPADSPVDVSAEFARFCILEKIGEGGCGVVYRAEQLHPVWREVALKVIKLGLDSQSVIARFEAERQALALMDHPGIAKVFDAGTSRRGRPFFAMELVPGKRITDYCDQRQLSIALRLELFAQVCDAVQHAHQKGVIHRDLKPSNILVTEQGGLALPKVIDFGLAKATSRQRLADQTIYTAFDQFVGTPAYMSPEQAGATAEEVDTRTDIYALGVLLYELLTGRAPFEPERLRQAEVGEVIRIIREEEPARPSRRLTTLSVPELSEISSRRTTAPFKLLREVSGDLDWVVMKALEKLPVRRYATANALATEVRRYLDNEPVVARPPSAGYRLQKMVRRNRLAVTAGAMVFLALLTGSVVSTWRFFLEQEARQRAVSAESQALSQAKRSDQVAQLLKEMLEGAGPSAALGRDTAMLREILDQAVERVSHTLKGDPQVEADMMETIGRAYFDLKQLDKAEAAHRRALSLRTSLWGETNQSVADSLVELALVLNTRGERKDLVEAHALLQRALLTRYTLLGEQDDLVADVLQVLGWNLEARGETAEAEVLLRQALSIREQSLDAEAPVIAANLNGLARLLAADPTRLGEAENYARRALEIQRHANPNDPRLIYALDGLAAVLTENGRLDEGETLYREAIDLRRRLYGEDGLLIGLLNGLAYALMKAHKYAEAEQTIREAIALQIKFRGPKHPQLASTLLGVLCDIHRRQGKWPEVESVAREWIPLMRETIPERRETLLHGLQWFGAALVAQGKWGEAETVLRESLQLCLELGNAPARQGPSACVGTERMLGETLLRLNRPAEAESLLLAAYDDLRGKSGGPEASEFEKTLRQLVDLSEAVDRPAQATRWRKEWEEFQKSQQGLEP